MWRPSVGHPTIVRSATHPTCEVPWVSIHDWYTFHHRECEIRFATSVSILRFIGVIRSHTSLPQLNHTELSATPPAKWLRAIRGGPCIRGVWHGVFSSRSADLSMIWRRPENMIEYPKHCTWYVQQANKQTFALWYRTRVKTIHRESWSGYLRRFSNKRSAK